MRNCISFNYEDKLAETQADQRHDLVIVGSGLAGTVTLVQELLRISADKNITPDKPVDIAILERYPQQKFGGVAYGKTADFEQFRLNLSAKRATPFMADDIPAGFPSFPDYIIGLANNADDRQQKERILGYLENPPRQLFGDYLGRLVDLALEKAGGKAKVTTEIGEALDMDVTGPSPKLMVRMKDKMQTIEAGQVVLATGQREILRPEFVKDIVDSPLYLENIYSSNAKPFYDKLLGQPPGHALIIGTGLSADDAALRLLQSGYKGKITMISRNGLEHAGYGAVSVEEYLKNSLVGEPRPEKKRELEKTPPRFMRVVNAQARQIKEKNKSLDDVERDVVTAMRREFGVLMKRGYTPEEVLGYWERFIPDIGNALPDSVCANIYNRHATWLGTHRVGTTPENTRIMEEARKSGQLEVVAGFISAEDGERMSEKNGKIVAAISRRARVERAGGDNGIGGMPRNWDSSFQRNMPKETLEFDVVIAGLGNAVTYDKSRDPFWAKMIEKGLAIPHRKAQDGIELDPDDLTLMDAKGKRVENVTAVGIPAFGATMYGHFPHPEEPGVYGGRILPFTANIVGITGGILAMVPGLHERLILDREQLPVQQTVLSAASAAKGGTLSQMQRGDLGPEFTQAGSGEGVAAPSTAALNKAVAETIKPKR
ncbi:MAG: hypothetical protein EPN97_13235 [Alphaproteobacteria bacterium]|nr:MAG: hypothetical protein EPN97_13235 [Alphaproteobacteria bacterium]